MLCLRMYLLTVAFPSGLLLLNMFLRLRDPVPRVLSLSSCSSYDSESQGGGGNALNSPYDKFNAIWLYSV